MHPVPHDHPKRLKSMLGVQNQTRDGRQRVPMRLLILLCMMRVGQQMLGGRDGKRLREREEGDGMEGTDE